jgi:hypothetical protein
MIKGHRGTVEDFLLPSVDEVKCTHVKNFKLEMFDDLKQKVVDAKSLYDKPYKKDKKRFYYIIRQFEHANEFKHKIHKTFNTPNVSNAWLKAYELFIKYNLLPAKAEKFVYFDNAAFPGSFILTAWHIVNTLCEIKDYRWYGSSLITSKEFVNKDPLQDKYKLYENYPKHWPMDEKNDGDVTSVENQLAFQTTFGNTVDLYTSDLGFDVSEDYNKQESIHAHANMGQILTGLLVLKEGGAMVTKQYSFFEPFTVSLMALLTTCFKETMVSKPMFSKAGNSETYMVCKGFIPDKAKSVASILLKRLENASLKPLVTKSCLGNGFLGAIKNAQTTFAENQISKLTTTISEYNRIVKSKKMDRSYITKNNVFAKQNIQDLEMWKQCNPMKTLNKHLKVKEVLFR